MSPLTGLTETRVLAAEISFREQPFVRPLKLSTGVITSITEATARVTVEVGGRRASGRGCIYLSDLWAWPDPELPHARRDEILREICQAIADELPASLGAPAHPLELGLQLHHLSTAFTHVPLLASALCASPFDAALHDAAGRALGVSAFRFYEEDAPIPSADGMFRERSAVRAIRAGLRAQPVEAVPGCVLVGGLDDLGEEFAGWAARFAQFKIKIGGKDARADAGRVAEVFQRARECGQSAPRLSLDSNEGHPDAASVAAFLDELLRLDQQAYDSLLYLEQPTGRDINQSAFSWHAIARRKPVFLDEGLTSLDLLPLAREQGWSGLALKTCKGHSFLLCSAAWALENGLQLTLQDLTNPGLAAVHSWLVASHLPTLNGIELNSPQFTPAANADWLPEFAGLFAPPDGCHRLGCVIPIGLGSALQDPED